jgi:hypothetical protein
MCLSLFWQKSPVELFTCGSWPSLRGGVQVKTCWFAGTPQYHLLFAAASGFDFYRVQVGMDRMVEEFSFGLTPKKKADGRRRGTCPLAMLSKK